MLRVPNEIFTAGLFFVQTSRRLQHERDTVVSLRHESTALQARLSEESEAVERLEQVLELVERLESAGDGSGPQLSLEECVQAFQQMQTHFYNEYKSMGLADLAVSVVHPILNEKLRNWDPVKVKMHVENNAEQLPVYFLDLILMSYLSVCRTVYIV